jgi:hypothetical protein
VIGYCSGYKCLSKDIIVKTINITRPITKHNTNILPKDITVKRTTYNPNNNQSPYQYSIKRHYGQNNHYNPNNNNLTVISLDRVLVLCLVIGRVISGSFDGVLTLYPKKLQLKEPLITRTITNHNTNIISKEVIDRIISGSFNCNFFG